MSDWHSLTRPCVSCVVDHRDGFIAGTTNPYFKEKCDWDVLADLESGKVVIRSPKVEQLITGQVVSSMSEKSTSGYLILTSLWRKHAAQRTRSGV